MSKVTLEFNLPEEQYEANLAFRAKELMLVIHGAYNEIRMHIKHESDITDREVLESIQESLGQALLDNNC